MIPTEPVRPHINNMRDIVLGQHMKLDDQDIEGIGPAPAVAPTPAAPAENKKNKPDIKFKPCTLGKAYRKLQMWEKNIVF